jgi:Xaa-Pro aminopeptidase
VTPTAQGFSPTSFRHRREQAQGKLEGGALLLPAAPLLHRSRDTEHRYRPDSELFYLTGCAQPGVVALLRGDGVEPAFVLFVPSRDPKAELWSGARLGPEEAGERFGAQAAYPAEEMEGRLPELLKDARRIFFRLGVDARLEALVLGALRYARGRGARTGTGPRGVTDPGEILDELRLRKDAQEIVLIRRAASLTVAAFRETLPRVAAGMGEWEVESLLESAFRRRGAQGPAFPTIVGSGANGCVLHYSANASVVEAGALILLDGGAEAELYAGDVTRTVPASGRFDPQQLAVYRVVLRALEAGREAVRPGAPVAGIHERVVHELTRGLVELGALTGAVEELVRARAYESFFPHQTSHWLGLDVHDPGDYVREGASRRLEPGMVLTVEPGLYFGPREEGAPAALRGIGIRLEDDILVTEKGWENLTGDLPVEPGEVEALLAAGATPPD